ncbi:MULTISPECIES: SRPBCC family protein [unclassified Streptomyces]|uniref:SRPBCC family protein n=1 Tax=unclassified Streptomyces TaxID=2593676 RepID=UPI0010109C9B|nr:SRPBCC family protein [Streptomyces sp. GZWMJZ-114]
MARTEQINAAYTFRLPVTPEEAFARVSQPLQDPVWQAACVDVTLLNGEPRPGGQYAITFEMVGKRMDFTVEIDEFVPGVRSAFHTLSGPFGYVGTYTYTAQGDGSTTVDWTFDVDPGDYFGIMPKSLLRKVLVNGVKKDAAKLAERLRKEAVAS